GGPRRARRTRTRLHRWPARCGRAVGRHCPLPRSVLHMTAADGIANAFAPRALVESIENVSHAQRRIAQSEARVYGEFSTHDAIRAHATSRREPPLARPEMAQHRGNSLHRGHSSTRGVFPSHARSGAAAYPLHRYPFIIHVQSSNGGEGMFRWIVLAL